MNRTIKWLLLVLVLLLVINAGILYTEYLETIEIGEGFANSFWTNLNVQLLTQSVTVLFAFSFVLINLFIVRNNMLAMNNAFAYFKRRTPLIVTSVAAALGFVFLTRFGIAEKFLVYTNSEWFDLRDPIFYRDIGYYVFQRPFLMAVIDCLMAIAMLSISINLIVYVVSYARFDFYKIRKLFNEKSVLTHLLINLVLIFIIKAVSYKFVAEDILFDEGKVFSGAGYTDIKIWLTYYNIIPFMLCAVIFAAAHFTFKGKHKRAIISACVYPLCWLVTFIAASIVQTLVVLPNEMVVELPYINNNIVYTRYAYGIDAMTQQEFPLGFNLTGQTVLENIDIINNLQINDTEQTLKSLNKNQAFKNYYSFNDANITTYDMNDQRTMMLISAREVNTDKLDVSAKNYINKTMRYTHGMGVVMVPVNATTEQGQPFTVVKDIPPRSIEGVVGITQPRIYFGGNKNDYAIVNTKEHEFDELEGNYDYEGSAGIQMNLMNRLMFSIKNADLNILISDQIYNNSRLLVNRNVVARVKKVAPFLEVDPDATILIDDDGALKWVINAYTSSKYYPYAHSTDGARYVRNSVKAVVDAYDGSVKLYIIDDKDPIIKCYARIYPYLFEYGNFPEDLAQRTTFPTSLFKKQAAILSRYHLTNPKEFYQHTKVWSVSMTKGEDDVKSEVSPSYMMINIDGKPELVLATPFTLSQKDDMLSMLVVRCDSAHYGESILYTFDSNESVPGTYHFNNRIDADPEISRTLNLWSLSGLTITRGDVLVVPIQNSLLYVAPMYVSSGKDASELPEIKGIVVAYNDTIVMGENLDKALQTLFGINRPQVIENETIHDVIDRTVQIFNMYKEYSKNNDWENAGSSLQLLDEVMTELAGYNEEVQRAEY